MRWIQSASSHDPERALILVPSVNPGRVSAPPADATAAAVEPICNQHFEGASVVKVGSAEGFASVAADQPFAD